MFNVLYIELAEGFCLNKMKKLKECDIFMKLFKFDKHHKFERFGVIFCSLFLVMLIIVSIAFVDKLQTDNETMDNKVIYTRNFQTSISEINGTVDNIYKNKDNTEAFLVLHLEDTTNISTDAKNYQMYLTGAKQSGDEIIGEYLEHESLRGSIYLFGSSGYIGLHLVDSEGFASQLCDLVVRCNSQIKTDDESDDGEEENTDMEDSFLQYDQFRIYFNPGGKKCDVAEFLNKTSWSVSDAYEECVSRAQEEEIRKTLTNDVEQLKKSMDAIEEYTARLKGSNSPTDVAVPEMPEPISGDKFIEHGSATDDKSDDYIEYIPHEILPCGYEFDWYNGSVKSGYIDGLCGELTYAQYFNKKQSEESDDNGMGVSVDEWTLNDGTLINSLDASISENKSIVDNANLLASAWQTYYDLKQQYQCVDLLSLLYLEVDTNNVNSNYTINNDKKSALIIF